MLLGHVFGLLLPAGLMLTDKPDLRAQAAGMQPTSGESGFATWSPGSPAQRCSASACCSSATPTAPRRCSTSPRSGPWCSPSTSDLLQLHASAANAGKPVTRRPVCYRQAGCAPTASRRPACPRGRPVRGAAPRRLVRGSPDRSCYVGLLATEEPACPIERSHRCCGIARMFSAGHSADLDSTRHELVVASAVPTIWSAPTYLAGLRRAPAKEQRNAWRSFSSACRWRSR